MNSKIVFAATVLSVAWMASPAAHAQTRDCVIVGNINPIGVNSTGTIELNSGETCKMFLTSTGTIESSRVAVQPKHGNLTLEGAGSALYKPSAGYKGDDEFAITIIGRSQTSSGTSTLTVKAIVK